MILAALITIIGLVTGRYFFLLLVFPIGFDFFKKKDNDRG